MKIFNPLLLLFLAITSFLSACRKPIQNTAFEEFKELTYSRSGTLLSEDSLYDNFVAIVCSQVANKLDSVNGYDISLNARFSESGLPIDVGPIVVNGRTLVANSDTLYRFSYNDSSLLAEGKALLGASIDVSVPSMENRGMSNDIIVVPKEIYPTTFYYPRSTIDRAFSLPLIWAPDPTNQYQKVNIEISYYSGISKTANSNLPNSVSSLVYVVSDNGSFNVPQSDLERFPKGSYIGISISRASYLYSAGNVAYIAVVEGHSTPILVTDSRNPLFANIWSSVSTQNIGLYGYYSGDINADGYTDIIQPYASGSTLAFMVHDISGTSTNLICNNIMNGSGITNISFASGDFNGDGKDDMIQAWRSGNNLALSVFKSNGTSISPLGTWVTDRGYSTTKILSVDMDHDGYADIAQIWSNNGKLAINILRSTGTSYYTAWTGTFNESSTNLAIIAADYNGDGKTDIVQLWNNGGLLAHKLYKSTGNSYVYVGGATSQEGPAGWFAPVDYNADQKIDFIQGWSSNGKMSVLLHASNGSLYTAINNAPTNQNSANYGLLPIKRAGDARTGFVQIYANSTKVAFTRYWPLE
jgi:hypothetical protein